ncbi:MAG: hypothetical protein HY913_23145 [Desulfomonile tiedjei]|nr:hypothetical protein [Desulfomonile tiedjei]
MEYKHIDGAVHSRIASTPPIINSDLAYQYGIQVASFVEASEFTHFGEGQNVKLRLVLDRGTKRITCHAKIDWAKEDEATGQHLVGFGHLSLTDEEFQVLQRNFVEKSQQPLEFGVKVRDKAREAESVTVSSEAKEIMRLKAVNFPVSVIEAIDENRGDVPFSQFVSLAVRDYIRRQNAGR